MGEHPHAAHASRSLHRRDSIRRQAAGVDFLLADELFFIALDDMTGKLRQQRRALGLGLAGALLGDLLLEERIAVQGGVVVVIRREPPSNGVMHVVLDHLRAEFRLHPLRTWLAYLGRNALEQTARRLEHAGHLERVSSRWPWKVDDRWMPTDLATAARPGSQLRYLLQTEKPIEVEDVVLAGLVEAVGLSTAVLWGCGTRTLQYRDWCISHLDHPLRQLIAETKAAVGNAVLTHRA